MSNGLKDTIIVDWLDLDPDQLAAEVHVEMISRPRRKKSDGAADIVKVPYVSWQAIGAYNERVYQAFAGYKGSHTSDFGGYAYAWDWQEFLQSLRKARVIAADPCWEAPADGVVYRCLV